MVNDFKDIRAYRTGWLLPITDFLFAFPMLRIWAIRTAKSVHLAYLGDRKKIEADIKHGAFFITNHRDIVLDAAWLSLLLRCRYFIRPFIGIASLCHACVLRGRGIRIARIHPPALLPRVLRPVARGRR